VALLRALHSIPVVEGMPAVVHIAVAVQDTPVVDTLEASAALQMRVVAAHVDHEGAYAAPLVAVLMIVLLSAVRMTVPCCSSVSPF